MTDVDAISGATAQRRWLILGVIGLAQLMVILDATVMNIALVHISPKLCDGKSHDPARGS